MSPDHLSILLTLARKNFSLEIDEKISTSGVTAVFGPSGSGKTTLLRAIAGFETPQSGYISFKNNVWFDKVTRINKPPYRRGAGLVFQDARLFPHLDVRDNLRYALDRASGDATNSENSIIDQFKLSNLLERKPATLSGGERQRVAIARALLSRPQILMLDEPLAGLDVARKAEILPFLDTLAREHALPIIYVSHDLRELARIADRLVILDAGRVVRSAPAKELINSADSKLFGDEDAVFSIIDAKATSRDQRLGLVRLEHTSGVLFAPLADGLKLDCTVRLAIFARDVAVSLIPPEGVSIQNVLSGVIREITEADKTPYALLTLDIGGAALRARLTRAAVEQLQLSPGLEVYALIKSATLEALPGA